MSGLDTEFSLSPIFNDFYSMLIFVSKFASLHIWQEIGPDFYPFLIVTSNIGYIGNNALL